MYMADEIIEPTQDVETPEPRQDKRIKNLSEKVETTAKERDDFKAEAVAAKKEGEFYKGFAGMVSKYPTASGLEEKIKAKVMQGYSVDDATVATLVSEGRFNPAPKPIESPLGGSAINQPAAAQKSIKEMTQAEKLAELRVREARGEIYLS